ncbi:MAG TPA: hypothetical protein VG838_02355 [Opitutaceae bacterium]|nr:hypothetical protein [Opitutaceae bacterium]
MRKYLPLSLLLLVAVVVFWSHGKSPASSPVSHGTPAPSVAQGRMAPTALVPSSIARTAAVAKPAFRPLPASVSALPARAPAHGELRSRLVQADFDFLQNPASPVHNGDRREAIHLDLFDGTAVDFKVESTRYLEPGVFVTTGHAESELSLVVFASVHGKVVGTVVDPLKGQFTIEPTAANETYRIYENDPRAFACGELGEPKPTGGPSLSSTAGATAGSPRVSADQPAGVSAAAAVNPAADTRITSGNSVNDFWAGLTPPTSGTRVPVLALYNADMAAKAVNLFGSLDGLRARLEAGIALTNALMARARATAYLELVGMAQITFKEPTVPSSQTILSLVNQTPEYNDLQVKYRPALTTYCIVAEDEDASGFAGVATFPPGRQNAVYYQELNSTALAHEFGHNFGMQHNVEDAGTPDRTIPYSFGWRLPYTAPPVGDTMAYAFPGVTTFALPLYSDPTISYQGYPLGDAQVADNARVARENTAAIAAGAGFQFGAAGDNWISNLSTRGYVGASDQVLIAGLIVSGTTPKQIVLRGVGPSLGQYGIQQPLADPKIQLYSGSTVIGENDNWQSDSRANDLKALGLSPTNANEAALLVTLNPGAYTVILSGVNNTTGVGLVEAYEMDADRSRFSYWNSNQVTTGYSTDNESPLEFLYDFGGVDKNASVLFQLTSSPAGKYIVSSRRDSTSPTPIDPYLQVLRVPKGQNPFTLFNEVSVASNDNWQDSSSAALLATSGINGLSDPKTAVVVVDTSSQFDYWLAVVPGFPTQSRLSSGKVDISLYNVTGTTGTGESSRLVDVATRGVFSSGEKAMIAGFVIGGTTSRTVAVRALGQSLAQYGLTGLAPNPKLTIYDGASKILFTNDDWQKDANQITLQRWGLAPTNASEAAMVATLQPGAYTVVVENNGQEGVGLVEVYELR